jgi:hypothetical protein
MLTVTTANQLAEVVPTLNPGEGVIYHTGYLHQGDERVQAIAVMARQLSNMSIIDSQGAIYLGMGMVTLVQRRISDGFEYIAVKVGRQISARNVTGGGFY